MDCLVHSDGDKNDRDTEDQNDQILVGIEYVERDAGGGGAEDQGGEE